MPPSLRQWLPEGHLAWFVLDAVAEMELSAFSARCRHDGWERAAYAPEMMVALTVCSYCPGERSARVIERRLGEDVAYRVIAANQTPDRTTIASFRQHNEQALAGLFAEIFRLCSGAGLVRTRARRSPKGPAPEIRDAEKWLFGHSRASMSAC
jgi:transposase